MKEKIIEIIGFGMEPERAELKANQIILLINQHVIDTLKSCKNYDLEEFVDKVFIKL